MSRAENALAAAIALLIALVQFHGVLAAPPVPEGLWPVIEVHIACALGFAALVLAAMLAELALVAPTAAR